MKHGKSTGKRIYYGIKEASDLSQLLDELARVGSVSGPVAAMGESYGAALALRWKGMDSRVRSAVAIAPYAELSKAALNIRSEYAAWMPSAFVRAGLKQLPSVLDVQPAELDTTAILAQNTVAGLFVAGGIDKIVALADVRRLEAMGAAGSELVVVPQATHESVLYFFDELAPPILSWLNREAGDSGKPTAGIGH